MGKEPMGTSARYQKIAADIASKIVTNQYQEGQKIYARSLIASQYSVSSETARKAVALLTENGVVETIQRSGVVIKSCDHAIAFLKRFESRETVSDMKQEVMERLWRIMKEGEDLRESVSRLVDYTDTFRYSNPMAPFSVSLKGNSPCIGQTIGALRLWQKTSATAVAIRREDSLIISPGPDVEFREGDTLYFVGDESCVEHVAALVEIAE